MNVVPLDIIGDIDDALADEVVARLRAAPNAQEILAVVTSHGGDDPPAWRIYNAVKRHSARRKAALGIDRVDSAAVLVFAAFDVREVLPGTRILLHGLAGDPKKLPARLSAAALHRMAAPLLAADRKVARALEDRTGTPAESWLAEMSTEEAMPLPAALSKSLVHHVVGQSPAPTAAWADKVRADLARRRFSPRMSGAAGYLFRDSFLQACDLAAD